MKTIHRLGTFATVAALSLSAQAQISGDVIRIGFITDMSGPLADLDGPGGVESIKMAIADMGGAINGKKIELLVADHQNKADIAATKAREWFDQSGLDMLIGGTNSSASLAMIKVAAAKKKPFLAVGAGATRLTNEDCTPYTVHYAYDTAALARGTATPIVQNGDKSWFFITADYAFGISLETDAADVVKANGGTVVGSVHHPLGAPDFSSFLMQAKASKAQVLALANAGADSINAVKAANEFGVNKSMKITALVMNNIDVHALGLQATQGMYMTDSWYWDQTEASRTWSKRFFAQRKTMPSMLHAADYSAAMYYFKGVKATGSDDGDKIMAWMRSTPVSDMYTAKGVLRADGRLVHDMYLYQVKKPSESRYPWDYYSLVKTVPGDQAFLPLAGSKCPMVKN